MRGNYFYDFAMASEKDSLPDESENRAIMHGDITDAYFLTRLGSADQFTVRLGKQVISWGENTFIGGSLNDINTVDISKLRQPGVELKDALVGTPAVVFQLADERRAVAGNLRPVRLRRTEGRSLRWFLRHPGCHHRRWRLCQWR